MIIIERVIYHREARDDEVLHTQLLPCPSPSQPCHAKSDSCDILVAP